MRKSLNGWLILTFVMALVMTTPIWTLVGFLFEPTNDNWSHLTDTLLTEYIVNSLWLMFGVAIGTLLLGIPSAWLVSQYQFTGRTIFQWALLLPMALPAYIIAYTYTGMLEFEGPVQSFLRHFIPVATLNSWFPEVRSLGGAIVMFSLVLYPYVYLLARASFASNGAQAMEASRTLGAGPFTSFYRVALPMARPAIIAGLTLALMETLADFGTVQYFGVPTFTTGIYRTWTGFGDTITTAQLSLVLLAFVLALILIELWSRRQARYYQSSQSSQPHLLTRLTGKQNKLAFLVCAAPILFGFLLPAAQLMHWSIITAEYGFNEAFVELIWNSFSLAFVTALITLAIALSLAYAKRIFSHPLTNASTRIATLGYAVPGTVMAIAVMIPLSWLDHRINDFSEAYLGLSSGLLLSGTLVALVFAYSLRFLSVALQSIDSGLTKIRPSMDESALTLGKTRWQILKKIHIPLLSSSLLTAFILVFVEVLKELPTTLILRPFNFNTLSVRAYEMAADERLADAGLPALLIVVTGLIPVIILSKLIGQKHA